MPRVKFTSHLQRFFPDLQNNVQIDGHTVADVVTRLEQLYPGLGDYIVDERGTLRKHVNIFIGDSLIFDREHLQDALTDDSQVFIFQALSGG